MSNTRHPGMDPAQALEAAVRGGKQQENMDMMQQLPEQVRPQPYPKAVGVGIETWNGRKVFAFQVFTAHGVQVLHFDPDEWDQLNAQVQARMVECRSILAVAQPGDLSSLPPL